MLTCFRAVCDPRLATRPITKLKCKHKPTAEGLGLPGEERDSISKELQDLAARTSRSQESGPGMDPGGSRSRRAELKLDKAARQHRETAL